MKNFFLSITLYISRIGLRVIYFFIKIFTIQKNKVTMLSRQSNNINIDFDLIKDELEKINISNENNGIRINNKKLQIKVLCKKIPSGLLGKISYCFYMLKCIYHIATSKMCIIDGYNIAISVLKHKKNLKVIQIWHAMGAIKKFGYQVLDKEEGSSSKVARIMKMHANYDLITCTSEETRKIYSEAFNTDINKIEILGMPRIDYILEKDGKINKKIENLYKDYPKLKEKKNIVYVPTFRKNETINIEQVISKVDKEKYNLIVRLHPLDKTKIESEYVIDGRYNTFDLIKMADYVITDYSAIAFETATLNKPLFFYLYDIDKYENSRGLNVNLKEEMESSTKQNIKDIIEIIENNTYNYEELKNFREKYIQTVNINNTKRIVEYVRKCIEK